MNKRIILMLAAFLVLPVLAAFPCQFSFILKDEGGSDVSSPLIPGEPVELELGETYRLAVTFTEDHRRCLLAPEETDFLLLEEKWKESKDYLPLKLLHPVEWKDSGSRSYTAELIFEAREPGTWELEVLRDCERGGYDEILRLTVG